MNALDRTNSSGIDHTGTQGPSPGQAGEGLEPAAKRPRIVGPAGPGVSSRPTPGFDRPCDVCRKRKLRCAGEPGSDKCFLCAFHQRPCTFLDRPQGRGNSRRPQRRKQPRRHPGTGTAPTISHGNDHRDGENEEVLEEEEEEQDDVVVGDGPAAADSAVAVASHQQRRGQASHGGEGSSLPLPLPGVDDRTGVNMQRGAASAASALPATPESPTSLLNRTLGLHKTTNSVYVGASSLPEPRLVSCHGHGGVSLAPSEAPGPPHIRYRRMDDSTIFVQRPDKSPDGQLDLLDDIEALVHPHGPALVSLYFRIIHPSYPILHKGVWFEKYRRSYREFSPPLLAAVYALATDWWEYDLALASQQKPPVDRLVDTATHALTWAMGRPKLSAVQAGLLLLQRSGGDSWVLTSQMVALSEELGLHADCSAWDIPDWEKGVRRRLAWAVFMQDKWGALIHGRPSHVSADHWQTPPLQLGDFPESAADEVDAEVSAEVEKGRHLFIRLAELTEIMAEAHSAMYVPPPRRAPCQLEQAEQQRPEVVVGLLDQVKPIALRLKHWASTLTPDLGMDTVKSRKLCANGYLHLSYYATEIIIHRHIIRSLDHVPVPDHNSTNNNIRAICRDAARTRLEHAMAFVERLRPEHLQGFWWFAAPKSLALIGVFAALLAATASDPAERRVFGGRLDDFHWSLKVRSKGSLSITAAVRELEDALPGLGTSHATPSPIAVATLPAASSALAGHKGP